VTDDERADLARLLDPLRVPPAARVDLARDFDPGFTAAFVSKKTAKRTLERGVRLLAELQDRLAAQETYGLVVVLQGLDASGKDSMIRHVMSGMNPQGVVVSAFKTPSAEELAHDFLWRCQRQLPRRGQIAVFNRSHYEEVVYVRVHPGQLEREQLPEAARGAGVWERRYREINDWERYLVDNGFPLVKLFLHLSLDEQRKRFLKRIERADKNWKFSPDDARERAHFDAYQEAFAHMLTETSTEWAPWYVIPADHKWFARLAGAAAIAHALAEIDPHYPRPSAEERAAMLREAEALEAEKRDAGSDGSPSSRGRHSRAPAPDGEPPVW
jgi:PPK2 family polyphosphate:nucleotide phosphotransferase